MRPARKITAEEENLRLERTNPTNGFVTIKRDPVEPEPVGTIVLRAFRVVGYDRDCDGSLMARLESVDKDGNETGWDPDHISLSSDCSLVITLEELKTLFVD